MALITKSTADSLGLVTSRKVLLRHLAANHPLIVSGAFFMLHFVLCGS